ncbi:large-conductance mechanosensitive channel protein MscL [Endomicrobium proavitum]|uniref:Large-conductance mechanosensitive channel n=1 Tax=Endomicrobium proavitum TaxID=1408281 RepID=A0A0G3WIZ2_9BACT|nr:large-conductance mechanosensitive channel protein MscL [Endomicrobium proavitum]AKL97860.1 mechanosensitive channel [Endomicrobium proavitum]
MFLKSFFKEFKDFAVKGNVIDMAVGIIIGAAFNNIVNSLVKDIIMPPIGILLGNIDFTNLFVVLKDGKILPPYNTLASAQSAGAVTLNIGSFINYTISFIIVAFAVFLMIKALNKFKEKPAPAPINTKECPYCATTIPLKAIKCPNCTENLK